MFKSLPRFSAVLLSAVVMTSVLSEAHAVQAQFEISVVSKNVLDLVSDRKLFTSKNCAQKIKEASLMLDQAGSAEFSIEDARRKYSKIVSTLFLVRQTLRSRLAEFSKAAPNMKSDDACLLGIRRIFRETRATEELISAVISARSLVADHGLSKATFQSGDVLLSRGTSYVSAGISTITKVSSAFSHVAMVYVKGPADSRKTYSFEEAIQNPNVVVIEARMDIGVTYRPLAQYLADAQIRNLLLRFSDQVIAHQAASFMFNKMKTYKSQAYRWQTRLLAPSELFLSPDHANFNIPYNFKMARNKGQAKDQDGMFCSEVAAGAFRSQGIELPLFASALPAAKSNGVMQALEISVEKTFAPGDAELDLRFAVVAEWTDQTKLATSRLQDAVLSGMYQWMRERQYTFYPDTTMVIHNRIGIWLRRLDLLGLPITRGLFSEFAYQMPKNATPQALDMIRTLMVVGEALETHLQKADRHHQIANGGRPMSTALLLQALEIHRANDEYLFRQNLPSEFHGSFRGPGLMTKPANISLVEKSLDPRTKYEVAL